MVQLSHTEILSVANSRHYVTVIAWTWGEWLVYSIQTTATITSLYIDSTTVLSDIECKVHPRAVHGGVTEETKHGMRVF